MPKAPPNPNIPLASIPPSTLQPPNRAQEHYSSNEVDSATGSSVDFEHLSEDVSRQSTPFTELRHPNQPQHTSRAAGRRKGEEEEDGDYSLDSSRWDGVNDHNMPSDLRHSMDDDKRNSHHQQPLLSNNKRDSYDAGNLPHLSQRTSSNFGEKESEESAKAATRKRYTYAAGFLLVSLVSFAVQTETAVYIQHTLHWNKAFCML